MRKREEIQQVLGSYVESKIELDSLTLLVNEMKKEVIKVLKEAPEQKAETEYATFSLRRSVTYKYSKKVGLKAETIKTENEVLKMMKREEEETGKATLIKETFIPVVKIG